MSQFSKYRLDIRADNALIEPIHNKRWRLMAAWMVVLRWP